MYFLFYISQYCKSTLGQNLFTQFVLFLQSLTISFACKSYKSEWKPQAKYKSGKKQRGSTS